MASFFYPRTITITRAPAQSGEGAMGYGGRTEATEHVIASGIAAGVQARREGQKNTPGLPTDGSKAIWRVYTAKGALPEGTVKDRDWITDDLGRKFQVVADYQTPLGGNWYCERLEA